MSRSRVDSETGATLMLARLSRSRRESLLSSSSLWWWDLKSSSASPFTLFLTSARGEWLHASKKKSKSGSTDAWSSTIAMWLQGSLQRQTGHLRRYLTLIKRLDRLETLSETRVWVRWMATKSLRIRESNFLETRLSVRRSACLWRKLRAEKSTRGSYCDRVSLI